MTRSIERPLCDSRATCFWLLSLRTCSIFYAYSCRSSDHNTDLLPRDAMHKCSLCCCVFAG